VRAPEPVIEDACQFAWGRLVHHAARVRRETALSWLAKTAVHEAFKLIRRDDRELSLDATEEGLERSALSSLAVGPETIAEHHERLAMLHTLPPRQQRMIWLHALGLSYGEIAIQTSCTVRTVERQLLRAKKTLRAEDLAQ
jgi:RNA polymerase sigma factor (sigma-70 family)